MLPSFRHHNQALFLNIVSDQRPRFSVSWKAFIPPQRNPISTLIENYIHSWCQAETISPKLLRIVWRLWELSEDGAFPSIDDIVFSCQSFLCSCADNFEWQDRQDFLKFFIVMVGDLPSCSELMCSMEFHRNEGRFPNMRELAELVFTLNNYIFFISNPEEHSSPVSNLELLQAVTCTEKKDCAICLENIEIGQACYCLDCEHSFHAESDKCLGDVNVLEWFKKHNTCPVCRQKITLKADTKCHTNKHS